MLALESSLLGSERHAGLQHYGDVIEGGTHPQGLALQQHKQSQL
jgi:hypothetical protein